MSEYFRGAGVGMEDLVLAGVEGVEMEERGKTLTAPGMRGILEGVLSCGGEKEVGNSA